MMTAGLSPLPAPVVNRLNVDHLSLAMNDHHYVWRSCINGRWGALIAWAPGQWRGWYRRGNYWHWINDTAVTAQPGERFIRQGEHR